MRWPGARWGGSYTRTTHHARVHASPGGVTRTPARARPPRARESRPRQGHSTDRVGGVHLLHCPAQTSAVRPQRGHWPRALPRAFVPHCAASPRLEQRSNSLGRALGACTCAETRSTARGTPTERQRRAARARCYAAGQRAPLRRPTDHIRLRFGAPCNHGLKGHLVLCQRVQARVQGPGRGRRWGRGVQGGAAAACATAACVSRRCGARRAQPTPCAAHAPWHRW